MLSIRKATVDDCHLSARAFQQFAGLDGLPVREIVRRLPARDLGLQPAAPP